MYVCVVGRASERVHVSVQICACACLFVCVYACSVCERETETKKQRQSSEIVRSVSSVMKITSIDWPGIHESLFLVKQYEFALK